MTGSLKYRISIFIVLLLVIISFFCLPFSISAQSNITKISLNKNSGFPRTDVLVIGENFSGSRANIYWDNKIITNDVPIINGKFSYNLIIPVASKGEHLISADDNSNWAGSKAETKFKVLPRIKIFPEVTSLMTPIMIEGDGFESNEENIQIFVDGVKISGHTYKADKDGHWVGNYVVQNINKGRHVITAYGNSTKENEVNKSSFILAPWLEVEPKSGPVGTQLIIKGWGFMHNEDGITVTWDNEIIKVNIRAEVDGSLIVDGSKREYGTFLSGNEYRETVYVPKSPQGTHVVGVYGSSFTPKGTLPTYNFTVIPQIKIQPSSGKKGSIVNIEGTGFATKESIKIKYDNIEIASGILADDTGSFLIEYVIPQGTGKEHIISAVGSSGNKADTKFIIETEELSSPSLISPKNKETIYIFNSVVDVYKNSINYLFGLGNYLRGLKSNQDNPIITFQWLSTDNSQNNKYIIQFSRYENFSKIDLEDYGLGNVYVLKRNNILPPDTYYWRVKYINLAGSESEWSSVYEYKLVSMPGRVIILSSLLLVLVIAIVVFIIILVWINSNKYKY